MNIKSPTRSPKINFRYEVQPLNWYIGQESLSFHPHHYTQLPYPTRQPKSIPKELDRSVNNNHLSAQSRTRQTKSNSARTSKLSNKTEPPVGHSKRMPIKTQIQKEEHLITHQQTKKHKVKVEEAVKREHEQDSGRMEEEDPRGGISRKGLAVISSMIVGVLEREFKQKVQFTCGQVANQVFDELCRTVDMNQIPKQILEKERKTIKRRVYDSINVLIALGKIKKQRRFLEVATMDRQIGQQMAQLKSQYLETTREDYKIKQAALRKAQQQLFQLRQLKHRNQELSQGKEAGHSTSLTTASHKGISSPFQFPLLVVAPCPSRIEVQQNQNRQVMHLQADQPSVLSELHAIQHLNLQNRDH